MLEAGMVIFLGCVGEYSTSDESRLQFGLRVGWGVMLRRRSRRDSRI